MNVKEITIFSLKISILLLLNTTNWGCGGRRFKSGHSDQKPLSIQYLTSLLFSPKKRFPIFSRYFPEIISVSSLKKLCCSIGGTL